MSVENSEVIPPESVYEDTYFSRGMNGWIGNGRMSGTVYNCTSLEKSWKVNKSSAFKVQLYVSSPSGVAQILLHNNGQIRSFGAINASSITLGQSASANTSRYTNYLTIQFTVQDANRNTLPFNVHRVVISKSV